MNCYNSNVYIVTSAHTFISPCYLVTKNVSTDKFWMKKTTYERVKWNAKSQPTKQDYDSQIPPT